MRFSNVAVAFMATCLAIVVAAPSPLPGKDCESYDKSPEYKKEWGPDKKSYQEYRDDDDWKKYEHDDDCQHQVYQYTKTNFLAQYKLAIARYVETAILNAQVAKFLKALQDKDDYSWADNDHECWSYVSKYFKDNYIAQYAEAIRRYIAVAKLNKKVGDFNEQLGEKYD